MSTIINGPSFSGERKSLYKIVQEYLGDGISVESVFDYWSEENALVKRIVDEETSFMKEFQEIRSSLIEGYKTRTVSEGLDSRINLYKECIFDKAELKGHKELVPSFIGELYFSEAKSSFYKSSLGFWLALTLGSGYLLPKNMIMGAKKIQESKKISRRFILKCIAAGGLLATSAPFSGMSALIIAINNDFRKKSENFLNVAISRSKELDCLVQGIYF